MATKHDELTQKELNTYTLDSEIISHIKLYLENNPKIKKNDFHILDWGCGRGISVLKLLLDGYSAFGVDIDQEVMKKGYNLFEEFGFDPTKRLLKITDIKNYPDGYFGFIFSEQVFEHVENINFVIQELGRLTTFGGIGYHVYPGSKMVMEGHLRMPFVHWLPKNLIRKYWIALMLLLKQKPKKSWPETQGKGFWDEVKVYYNYSNRKTFYRDNRSIKKIFEENKFEAHSDTLGNRSIKQEFIPHNLSINGFPRQQVSFLVKKT